MALWDKVRQELDRAGQVAQDALDEGRIRLEAHRARQAADKAAEALGYAVFRARAAGGALDDAELGRHADRLAEQEAEVTRLETQLRELQQRWRAGGGMGAPPGAAAGAAAASAAAAGGATTAAAAGATGYASATETGPPDIGPVGTATASAAMETPPEASGGPVPPPENTPPATSTYGVVPPVGGITASDAPETDKPTTDMWPKGQVFGHEPY